MAKKKKKKGALKRWIDKSRKEENEQREQGAPETPGDQSEPEAPDDAPSLVEPAVVSMPMEEEPVAQEPVAEENAPEAAPEVEERSEPEEPRKKGFFARLKQQLSKTKSGMVERVRQVAQLYGKVDEEMLEDIEGILVQADLGVATTTRIIDRLRKAADAKKAETPEQLIQVFRNSLREILSHSETRIALQPKPPTVILVVGVNGVGKTTTIGKLAREYRDDGKKVMMVAADTFRAAAIEQLTIWAERTCSTLVKQEMGSDPGSVCYDALADVNATKHDVILIDTAGRLHTKRHLMEELRKIVRVIKKVMPEAPHETLLILDATTGQNAVSQAKLFCEAVDTTGVVMTKLDGTAKGGILVAVRETFDLPIYKIGIGEGEDDLRDFDPDQFVDALFES